MKNLKKLMSVILAVALIASFAVIGAGAAFTDQDKITYETPVAVLTGAGVIDGYDTGAFGPTDTLTREQAAKLICYALLGKTLADKLVCETDPFKDVPAKKWSAPFIAYCVSKDIVAGDGTGNFNPADEVTGNQFAKMILCAMGYGKNGEFVGANWEINTAVEAYGIGLFTGSNADLSAPATREEAALYLFNAIELPFQVYSKDTDSYTNTSATFATKMGIVKTPATDDFGHTGYVWTKANAPITGLIKNEVYNYTTTNGQWPVSAIGAVTAAEGCTYYYNGTLSTIAPTLKPGDVAEFIVNAANQATKVVVVSKSFGYVAAVPTYNPTTKALSMTIGGTAFSGVAKYDVPTDLVVGSAVLYVTANGKLYVEKAVAVSGQLKAVSSDAKSINFGGSLYTVSGASVLSLATPIFNVDATLYTDANGYALDVKGGSGPAARYAVLLNADKEPAPLFGQETNKIMILNPDGTIEVLTAAADYRTLDKNVWYKVGANATGTLLSDADTLETALALTGNKAVYAPGHVGNSNTVFISYIAGKVNVYTGIANLPSMTNANISAIANPVTGIDTLVYIAAGTASGTTAQDVAYLYSSIYTMTPDAVTAGAYDYVYSAVVDGAVTTLTFDNVNTAGEGLKAVTYTNGRVTAVGDATGYTVTAGTGAAANGIVMLGTSYFTYNDNTKVIVINNGVVTIGTAASILADDNDTVTYKNPVAGTDLLTTVYIVKVAPAPAT